MSLGDKIGNKAEDAVENVKDAVDKVKNVLKKD